MKTQTRFSILMAACLFATSLAWAGFQDPTEKVPGDNFSLEGALELFKNSQSPQEFEQLLNSPDSKVNNLDLNGDGDIDYIRVIDRNEGNVHTFTLQAIISQSESQDVAVIELEKRDDGTAVLQIVGDPDVYGIETIIEPTNEVRVNAGTMTQRTTVNVWGWPCVQYVYGPAYSLWVSPWGWQAYPGWYRPWRPLTWGMYYSYWTPYRPYYSVCYSHRILYAPRIYYPYRSTSVVVYNRHHAQITNYRDSRNRYPDGRGSSNRWNRYDNTYRRSNDTYDRGNYSRSHRDGSSNGRTYDATRDRSSDRNRSSERTRSWSFDNGNSNRTQDTRTFNGGRSSDRQQTNSDRTMHQRRTFSNPSSNGQSGGGNQRTFNQRGGGSGSEHRSFQPSHRSGSGSGSQGGGRSGGGHSSGGSHSGGGGSHRRN